MAEGGRTQEEGNERVADLMSDVVQGLYHGKHGRLIAIQLILDDYTILLDFTCSYACFDIGQRFTIIFKYALKSIMSVP